MAHHVGFGMVDVVEGDGSHKAPDSMAIVEHELHELRDRLDQFDVVGRVIWRWFLGGGFRRLVALELKDVVTRQCSLL
jgi:hypothetical protein